MALASMFMMMNRKTKQKEFKCLKNMLILFILSYFYTYPIGFYIFFQTTSGLLSQFSLTRLKIEEK